MIIGLLQETKDIYVGVPRPLAYNGRPYFSRPGSRLEKLPMKRTKRLGDPPARLRAVAGSASSLGVPNRRTPRVSSCDHRRPLSKEGAYFCNVDTEAIAGEKLD